MEIIKASKTIKSLSQTNNLDAKIKNRMYVDFNVAILKKYSGQYFVLLFSNQFDSLFGSLLKIIKMLKKYMSEASGWQTLSA